MTWARTRNVARCPLPDKMDEFLLVRFIVRCRLDKLSGLKLGGGWMLVTNGISMRLWEIRWYRICRIHVMRKHVQKKHNIRFN